MNKIQSESVTLQVSAIGFGGWWSGNFTEYVSAGTALGEDFTEVIYTPSDDSKTAQFNVETQEWLERDNNCLIEFYDESGNLLMVDLPDADLPDWAIFEEPPIADENSRVEWVGGEWVLTPLEDYMTLADKAKEYLEATDFYVTRKMETGASIPSHVMRARDECRAAIVTTLPSTDFLSVGE